MDAKDTIIAQLREVIDVQARRIAELEAEIARLKKNASTSSKPPGSDIVKPPKPAATPKGRRNRKRKRGGQCGHRKHIRPAFEPEQIDPALARWGKKLLDHLRALFGTLHRRERMTEAGFARAMEKIRRAFLPAVVRAHLDAPGHLRPATPLGLRLSGRQPRRPLPSASLPVTVARRTVNGYPRISLAGQS